MLLKRLVPLVFVVVVTFPSHAWQTSTAPNRDPQSIAILQQSIINMGGTLPADSVATGNIQTVAGSQTSQGTIRILTKGTAESLVQITTPDTTQTCIFSNFQANELTGATVAVLPLELVVTSQAPDFPTPLLAALLNDPDTSFQYVALESANGLSLHHIQAWDSFASQPTLQGLADFSLRDIWINASTGLPQRISYERRPAHGAVAGVAVDVFYSRYQNSSGLLYPSTIQKSLNGTPWATITIQNVAFNTGLTDSDFPVQ